MTPLLIIFFCIALLIFLISTVKLNTFLSFLVVSILTGLLLGIPLPQIAETLQKGVGEMLGSLLIIIVTGAMLGKLVAESGAAQQITSGMMKVFGRKYIHWGMMITGFIIGIPLFYNVGFVLVVPFVFAVAYRYKISAVFPGIPMLASLSVTHGFLPPHPSPAALVAQFHASMSSTLLYGMCIAVPAVILAGPVFATTLKKIKSVPLLSYQTPQLPEEKLPSLTVSVLTSLFPVFFITATTLLLFYVDKQRPVGNVISFIGQPSVVMLLSLLLGIYSLGIRNGMGMARIGNIFGDAAKDISMLLLIIAGAGAFKETLVASGVNIQIADALKNLPVHPLVLGWLLAALIRVCLGSATIAGLTAASILAPMVIENNLNPNLMVLSVGAGSLFFSHLNDSGFWLFKEYFNLSIQDTFRSWSAMETIISIIGLIGVMLLNIIV